MDDQPEVVKVYIKDDSSYKPKPYGYIEFWNPSVDQLLNLVPYLRDNHTVAFVWVYGNIKDVPDYSLLVEDGIRIAELRWLGETKEEAYEFYTNNRSKLMGDFLKGV